LATFCALEGVRAADLGVVVGVFAAGSSNSSIGRLTFTAARVGVATAVVDAVFCGVGGSRERADLAVLLLLLLLLSSGAVGSSGMLPPTTLLDVGA
jgi:hypothetical protein